MRVCFTGHRPDRLGTGYSISNARVCDYRDMLADTVRNLIKEGAVDFYTGGAIGVDQIAFWTVEMLKQEFPHIQNIVAVPFKNQYVKWKDDDLNYWYHKMLERADKVFYVDMIDGYKDSRVHIGQYSAYKLNKRNHFMVDQTDVVVAVWDKKEGSGTYNCIHYAQCEGKRIITLPIIQF